MSQRVTFEVWGALPAPQGSKRARPIYRRGEFTGKVALEESSQELGRWRDRVAVHARRARRFSPSMGGPVAVTVSFRMRRPLDHYVAGDPTRPIRGDRLHLLPAVRPDVDKLLRAVLDALTTAHVYDDDAQVVSVMAAKVYAAERPLVGCEVTVWSVEVDAHGRVADPLAPPTP